MLLGQYWLTAYVVASHALVSCLSLLNMRLVVLGEFLSFSLTNLSLTIPSLPQILTGLLVCHVSTWSASADLSDLFILCHYMGYKSTL